MDVRDAEVEDAAGLHRAGCRHVASRPGDIRRFEVDNGALERLGLRFDKDWRAIVRDVIASRPAA